MKLKKLNLTKESLLSLNSVQSEAAAGGKRIESNGIRGCGGSCIGNGVHCQSNRDVC